MNQPLSPTELEHPPGQYPPERQIPASQHPPEEPRKSRAWLWIVVLLLLAAGGYYYWSTKKSTPQTGTAAPEKGGGRGGRGAGAIPIVAVKATRGDIGVFFNGLGSVTPINTVTVRTRVDGQLMSIHYKEGDLVKQGDLLLEIDPRPYQVQLEQYEGQLARDQSLLENSKVDLTRYETLLKQNAIPEQQLATQKSAVAQYVGIVKTDQGLIDSAKLNLTYCKITAAISGRIGLRLVDSGNIVHASDSNGLLVITQIQPISVIFTIAEDQLPVVLKKMRAGQRLPVYAYDREMKTKIASGFLATTDNQIDQSTGTLKLRANFDNSANELFPNQFVNARLLVEDKGGVILLPTAAIQRNPQMIYVWTVKPDNTVTVRQITIGVTEGDQSEVTSGLKPGDIIVMTGVDKLQEGTKVNVHYEGEKPAPEDGGAPAGKATGKTRTGRPGGGKKVGRAE